MVWIALLFVQFLTFCKFSPIQTTDQVLLLGLLCDFTRKKSHKGNMDSANSVCDLLESHKEAISTWSHGGSSAAQSVHVTRGPTP